MALSILTPCLNLVLSLRVSFTEFFYFGKHWCSRTGHFAKGKQDAKQGSVRRSKDREDQSNQGVWTVGAQSCEMTKFSPFRKTEHSQMDQIARSRDHNAARYG